MNNALKILIGVIIFLVGAWMMVNPTWFGQSSRIYGLNWWIYTWYILRGSFGPLLIIIGIIVVWIAYEGTKP